MLLRISIPLLITFFLLFPLVFRAPALGRRLFE